MTSSEKHSSNTAPGSEDPWVGTALITLSATGFASLTLLGEVAIELNLNLPTLLGLRFLGAALILEIGLAITRRQLILPERKLTLTLFLLGAIGYAGQSALFFAGLSRNPASISSLLLYAYPIFVAILHISEKVVAPPSSTEAALTMTSLTFILIRANHSSIPRSEKSSPLCVQMWILVNGEKERYCAN